MQVDSRAVPTDAAVTVQIVTGHPLMDRATEIYREMVVAAGADADAPAYPPQPRAPWRTSFHIALDRDGTALGALQVTTGDLAELSLGPLVHPDVHLPGPVCECPSIAVQPEAAGRGVTELLYRSVYRFARLHGARSLATLVEPFTLELFREDYGIMFRALGPVTIVRGQEQIAVGEELTVIERELRVHRPEFLQFLDETEPDAEPTISAG